MSGSSRAGRQLSRCVVTLDAGVSISWAPDPDGSYTHGMEHHRREEAGFRARLDAATPAIEVLFDELETAGRRFESPTHAQFEASAQRGDAADFPICTLELWCKPPLAEAELTALVARVAKLVSEARVPPPEPEPEPLELEPPEPVEPPPARKPWWRFW